MRRSPSWSPREEGGPFRTEIRLSREIPRANRLVAQENLAERKTRVRQGPAARLYYQRYME